MIMKDFAKRTFSKIIDGLSKYCNKTIINKIEGKEKLSENKEGKEAMEKMKTKQKIKAIEKMNISKKKILIIKIFFSILFSSLFIVLTKVKITPIIGTNSSFSASVLFGPTISKFLGISFGTGSLLFAHFFGVIVGIYKIKSMMSYFTFFPIIFAGIYFARIFRSDKKLFWFPLACISLFILHPIGNSVWFYSLFWSIPLIISIGKERIEKIIKNYVARVYLYSLGTAFVDHAVGSVLFLYFMNIPREAWLMAIPLTIIERLIIAAGITLSYFFVKISIKTLKELFQSLAIVEIEDEKESLFAKVGYKGRVKDERNK